MPINGEWYNEIGSKVTLNLADPKDQRQVSGSYQTNVGKATNRTFPLTGRCDDAQLSDQVIAWVVVWDPPDTGDDGDPVRKPSITAWAGQYHVVQEIEFITTTWLLTGMTQAADDWESTNVSVDIFFRDPPTPEMLRLATRFGKAAPSVNPPIANPGA
ncbi:avidin/streptavidin family protein [Mycobacterium sp. BK086]|uniref:avidin/streptavidin family protein n=1 Tax=Mycobacterium sp. BK086 TaxID=2512165 RepID=UPI00105C864B